MIHLDPKRAYTGRELFLISLGLYALLLAASGLVWLLVFGGGKP